MKTFTILLFISLKVSVYFSQKVPFISLGASTISIGSTYGIKPNYDANYGVSYFFGEIDQAIKIKNVPIKISGRISDEPYRSGRPSYFRVSYDSYTYKRNELSELNKKLDSLNKLQQLELDSLFKLESKLSYYKQIGYEQDIKMLDSLELPNFNTQIIPIDTSSVNVNFQVLDGALPPKPSSFIDFRVFEDLIILQKEKIESIKIEQLGIESKINELNYKKNLGFFDGIKKFDLGLSSLSSSSLSHNTIPIQGFHVSGIIKKSFYDIAAGFTLKNQLFSNQVFDQLLTNSVNIFNLNDFFSVNNVRFVGSVIYGIGEKDKNCIAIENFYTGRSFVDIRNRVSSPTVLNNALSATYTPKRMQNISFSSTLGQSSLINDTIQVRLTDKLAIRGNIKLKFPKLGATFESMYRSLGSNYDGFSQGVYINNSTHGEFSYKQEIGSRIKGTIRYSEDVFSTSDSLFRIRKSKQGTLSLNWRVLRNTVLFSSYTLVNAIGDSLIGQLSHLGQFGLNNTIKTKNNLIVNSLSAGFASIAGLDSIQEMAQLSFQTSYKTDCWFFGVRTSFEYFSGLQRVFGKNYIFQPELGFNFKMADFSLAYQFLKSEQFRDDSGFIANFNFRPSEYITWHFSAQKWLERDTYFFLQNTTNSFKPYFIKVRLSIHLNVKK